MDNNLDGASRLSSTSTQMLMPHHTALVCISLADTNRIESKEYTTEVAALELGNNWNQESPFVGNEELLCVSHSLEGIYTADYYVWIVAVCGWLACCSNGSGRQRLSTTDWLAGGWAQAIMEQGGTIQWNCKVLLGPVGQFASNRWSVVLSMWVSQQGQSGRWCYPVIHLSSSSVLVSDLACSLVLIFKIFVWTSWWANNNNPFRISICQVNKNINNFMRDCRGVCSGGLAQPLDWVYRLYSINCNNNDFTYRKRLYLWSTRYVLCSTNLVCDAKTMQTSLSGNGAKY